MESPSPPSAPSKIRKFLTELDLECYANNFEQQHITIEMLNTLSDDDYKGSVFYSRFQIIRLPFIL